MFHLDLRRPVHTIYPETSPRGTALYESTSLRNRQFRVTLDIGVPAIPTNRAYRPQEVICKNKPNLAAARKTQIRA